MVKGNPDLIRVGGYVRHKTKWLVKQLSGNNKGHFEIFDGSEAASIECFYLADHGICPLKIAPAYGSN